MKHNTDTDGQSAGPSLRPTTVLMLLTNAYDPDPRVRQQALALIGMGCRVRLLAWDRDGHAPAFAEMEGVEVERVFLNSTHGRGSTQLFFYAALYLKMLWRGLRTPFDVVHCHDLDTLPLGFILGKLKRKPIVYDAHECFPDMIAGSVHPAVKRGAEALESLLIQRIDVLITVGEKLRRHFESRGARRSVVVGNWKELGEYRFTQDEPRQLRRNLNIPDDAVVVTCISQLLKNRMIGELVEAARPFPDVYVIVAGKGALEPEVRQWAGENPRVIFLGYIHAASVPAYTCASDAIYCGFDPAMPNFRFAAPNKLFEALAAGKPLISPDLGEIGDIIRRGECGVVLPDCSVGAIREALEAMRNPELRTRWTANARELGRTEVNWSRGRAVLAEEYSRMRRQSAAVPGTADAAIQPRDSGQELAGAAVLTARRTR